jgi:hypothetical protein
MAYFTCLPIRSNKIHNIEKIKMRRVSQESIIAIGNDLRNGTGRLDLSTETDPNVNYEALMETFHDSMSQHIPIKEVKFNRHKHKGSSWITAGILFALLENAINSIVSS